MMKPQAMPATATMTANTTAPNAMEFDWEVSETATASQLGLACSGGTEIIGWQARVADSTIFEQMSALTT